jgi:hypothetical protein
MATYKCDDDSSSYAVEIEADSAREAAEEYAYDAFETTRETQWITILVISPDGERTHEKITIEPEIPVCEKGHEHDFAPGDAWGHGGGITRTDICSHCGLRKHIDTWAQDMSDGEQGLLHESYDYGDQDE